MTQTESRVLAVTDTAAPSDELLEAIRLRAAQSPTTFRVLVPNPARAELHLLHPERHDKAKQAVEVLRKALPVLSEAAGSLVHGSVSVLHDPMDAIEQSLHAEPASEILVSIHESSLRVRLHQDLEHRLVHQPIPVVSVPTGPDHDNE